MATKTDRAGERRYSFNMLFTADEVERLQGLAARLGWSRAAILRHGLTLVEGREEALGGEPPPTGNRRTVTADEEAGVT